MGGRRARIGIGLGRLFETGSCNIICLPHPTRVFLMPFFLSCELKDKGLRELGLRSHRSPLCPLGELHSPVPVKLVFLRWFCSYLCYFCLLLSYCADAAEHCPRTTFVVSIIWCRCCITLVYFLVPRLLAARLYKHIRLARVRSCWKFLTWKADSSQETTVTTGDHKAGAGVETTFASAPTLSTALVSYKSSVGVSWYRIKELHQRRACSIVS